MSFIATDNTMDHLTVGCKGYWNGKNPRVDRKGFNPEPLAF